MLPDNDHGVCPTCGRCRCCGAMGWCFNYTYSDPTSPPYINPSTDWKIEKIMELIAHVRGDSSFPISEQIVKEIVNGNASDA